MLSSVFLSLSPLHIYPYTCLTIYSSQSHRWCAYVYIYIYGFRNCEECEYGGEVSFDPFFFSSLAFGEVGSVGSVGVSPPGEDVGTYGLLGYTLRRCHAGALERRYIFVPSLHRL
jgi:hypothetical protein